MCFDAMTIDASGTLVASVNDELKNVHVID